MVLVTLTLVVGTKTFGCIDCLQKLWNFQQMNQTRILLTLALIQVICHLAKLYPSSLRFILSQENVMVPISLGILSVRQSLYIYIHTPTHQYVMEINNREMNKLIGFFTESPGVRVSK